MPANETEKIILFYCGLEVYEKRLETVFWLTVSTNGTSTRFSHKWNNFSIFRKNSDVADCDRWKNFLKKKRFVVSVVFTRSFDKTKCAITAKQIICRILILERIDPNMEPRSTLQTIVTVFTILFASVDTETLLSSTKTFETIDIFNKTLI